jgi:four helix bundle protein
MAGARSHEELVVWQLAYELKLGVYALIRTGPIRRDLELVDQLRRSSSAAPRLIAEGFGRYLPGEFSRYLRNANGELKETFDALRDAVDRGYVTQDQIVPLQRLSKRASKAASSLIKYLRTATPPHETPPRRPRDRRTLLNPPEPNLLNPLNPLNP